MAMDVKKLADEIKVASGQGAHPTSKENQGLAKAIVEEFQKLSVVTFAPGTVTGVAPSSGGKLKNGTATGGTIAGPTPASLAKRIGKETGFGAASPDLLKMATGIVTHYLTGKVSFAVGKITGKCSNTASSPGALAGEGSGGKILGLKGPVMAGICSAAFGGVKSKELVAVCTAIANHVTKNAEVSFKSSTIVGAIPSGGGPVTVGAGTKGTVK